MIWRIELFHYLPIAFFISCIIGLVIVEIERSVIYTIVCTVIGNLMAATILLLPHRIFRAGVGEFNIAIFLVLSSIGKLFLVSAAAYFLGVMLGCYLGQKTTEMS